MKKYIYLGAMSALMLTGACESDLEKVHYQEALSQSAKLAPLQASYVLEEEKSNDPAIRFTWTRSQVNYPASVTTDLQMDLSNHGFANPVTLASTKTDSIYTISVGDLNQAMLKLISNNGQEVTPTKVIFRLVSRLSADVSPLVSNVVSTTITPYGE
ncbi:MAG: SusE domain-containing protein [Bacteroides sp.]|nr:SusE domain-containing protein [Bacteroides sp.]